MSNARTSCKDGGQTLATMIDADDIANLKQAFSNAGQSYHDRRIALGLDDLVTEGQWAWDDGSVKQIYLM